MKILIIYSIIISLLLITSIFIIKKLYDIKEGKQTNYILLTNYIEKTKPKFVTVNITNTNLIFTIVDNMTNTNINLIQTFDEYSNLVYLVNEYSNFMVGDIGAVIKDGIMTLSYHSITNKIKLPKLYIEKMNTISLGWLIENQFYINYGRKFLDLNNMYIGAGIQAQVKNLTNADVGVNLFIEF